ncbi:hypothetical protein CIB84_009028 [Bambusicola thoracicus]|uniref:Uncharacterized protein n=1 Tax=Bambusicola thoracicus TaxID=9083 RepID=A0A2P4SSY9_BAMTH|nr:hypothetical protein CIB84_009028 [Bambusicola thoracicus]
MRQIWCWPKKLT